MASPWLEAETARLKDYVRLHGSQSESQNVALDNASLAQALASHRGLARRTGADAVLVARNGEILEEWYSDRYESLTPLTAMSSTKSVTSLNRGYGLLWWLFDAKHDGFRAFAMQGYLDASMFVFPDSGIVLVRMQAPKSACSGLPESGSYLLEAKKLFRVLGR